MATVGAYSMVATLLWGLKTQKPATDAEFIFDSVQAAWESVRYRAEP